jgi:hypothetical protein
MFHTWEADPAAIKRAEDLRLTMQEFVDKILNGEFDGQGGR